MTKRQRQYCIPWTTPSGEAPQDIRDACVGVPLPVRNIASTSLGEDPFVYGVETGERGRIDGKFVAVETLAVVAALRTFDQTEAADYWLAHYDRPRRRRPSWFIALENTLAFPVHESDELLGEKQLQQRFEHMSADGAALFNSFTQAIVRAELEVRPITWKVSQEVV